MSDRNTLLAELLAGPRDFATDGNDWSVNRQAEALVKAAGWSIGPSDRSQCRGVLFACGVDVAKWHTMNSVERAGCDAVVVGDGRNGPLTLTLTAGGRKRAETILTVAGPDIGDVYKVGYVATTEAEAYAQARAQIGPYIEQTVVFEMISAAPAADWEELEWFTAAPGEVIVAHVDMLNLGDGWDGEVHYPEWVISATDPNVTVICQQTGVHYRLADLYDLTFQPPGVGTREGHRAGVTLIEPVGAGVR